MAERFLAHRSHVLGDWGACVLCGSGEPEPLAERCPNADDSIVSTKPAGAAHNPAVKSEGTPTDGSARSGNAAGASIPQLRTDAEIEQLKRDWLADPGYDIEDAPGFEAHRHELTAFRYRKLYEWRCANELEAERFGLTPRGHFRVIALEERVAKLEALTNG